MPIEIVAGALLLAVIVAIVWVAITVSIRVRFNHWQSADSKLEPIDGKQLADDVTQILADLDKLGFQVRGHWLHTGHSQATATISLLENEKTLDLAKILVVTVGTRRKISLLFLTQFDDGTEIATANNRVTAGLPPLPGITVLWLPEVRGPQELARIHTQARDLLGSGMKPVPIGPDPDAFLIDGFARMRSHFVKSGYYYLDESAGVYRPTWKGAMLMTWRQLWPIRPLYRAWRRRPTRRILRDIGVQLECKAVGQQF